jgi:hypothetical protein
MPLEAGDPVSGEDGGLRMEDGDCGSAAGGAAGAADGGKPISESTGRVGIFDGSIRAGFDFSGKFGSAEVSGAGFG